MKKEFEFPEISIYSFLAGDIITASPNLDFETGEEEGDFGGLPGGNNS